jgi:hypothetical protein
MILVIMCFALSVNVFAREVVLESTSSGVYQNGEFKKSEDKFKARYYIDEMDGWVRTLEVSMSDREGRVELLPSYEIVNHLKSKGISGLLVPREKKGQQIITAVRDEDLGATEILIIGENFYEYCRGSNGKFYLESGEVS